MSSEAARERTWSSICNWGPTALLPIFQILGTDWTHRQASSLVMESDDFFDLFTRIDFIYKDAVASMKVGTGVKSEGELIVSGTKGYVYIPAPCGRRTTLKCATKTQKITADIFTSWTVKAFATPSPHF